MPLRTAAFLLLAATLAAAQEGWKTELKNVKVPMRDGQELAADLYLPPNPGKFPAVLIQTPYNKSNMGAVMSTPDAPASETGRGSASDLKVLMDRDHYAYVVVDWRGFYGSRAAMAGVRPQSFRRGLDGYDTVEWIAVQEWSDGRVGTWGGSALGKQQLDTAAEQPPHLVCCAPLIAAMGIEYEMYYEGGVLLEGHVKRLDQLGFGVGEKVKANPLSGGEIWKWGKALTYKPALIQVPCLMITGWWDNYPDLVIRTFEDIVARGGPRAKSGSRLIVGPWDHVSIGVAAQGDTSFEKAALFSGLAARAFFDYWLRDRKDNGWDKTPRVRWWTVLADGWTAADSWSALERRTTSLFLHPDGTLAATPPAQPGTRAWTFNPADPSPTLGGANLPPMGHGPTDQSALSSRKDGAWYSTGRLDQPLPINGNVELALDIAASTKDCDLTARLCWAGPDGRPLLLADAAARARLRDSTAEPKPLTAGEKVRVTLRFPATAAAIPAGSELRVYVSSSNWPRYERNPGTGADHWDAKAAVEQQITLHHGASVLRLPAAK